MRKDLLNTTTSLINKAREGHCLINYSFTHGVLSWPGFVFVVAAIVVPLPVLISGEHVQALLHAVGVVRLVVGPVRVRERLSRRVPKKRTLVRFLHAAEPDALQEVGCCWLEIKTKKLAQTISTFSEQKHISRLVTFSGTLPGLNQDDCGNFSSGLVTLRPQPA